MKKFFTVLALIIALTSISACKKPESSGGTGNLSKAEIEKIVEDYIVEHPEILMKSLQSLQKKTAQADDAKAEAEISKRGDEIFNSSHSAFIGNPNGKKVVVEFFDYNCHYCKGLVSDIKKVTDENKDVKFIFKEMAILGETSATTALAALVVHDIAPQKYFAFHSALMAHKGPADDNSIAAAAKTAGVDPAEISAKISEKKYVDQLTKNMELAAALGINGTPTFIVNGKIARGALRYDNLTKLLNK